MIFRVEICLLKAEPDRLPGAAENEEVPRHHIYRVTLGVNAPAISAAVSVAAKAVSDSADENEEYLGGVVIETRATLVAPAAFEGYGKYFIQPMEASGIFYVSGRSHSATDEVTAAPALDDLASVRERRKSQGDGALPPFVFHRHPEELAPRHFRMVCPVCGYWKEFDHLGFMYSLFEGVAEEDEGYRLGQQTAKRAREFVEKHLQCVTRFSDGESGLLCLYDGDERYHTLDGFHEEKW